MCIAQLLSLEQAQALLEWSPEVVVFETAAMDVLRWGVKVDALVCCTPKATHWQKTFEHQQPMAIVTAASAAEFFSATCTWLVARGQTALNLMMQPSAAERTTIEQHPNIRTVLLDGSLKWSFVTGKYVKWMPQGARLYLQPGSNPPLRTIGLVARPGFFEVVADGVIGFDFTGSLWIGETA